MLKKKNVLIISPAGRVYNHDCVEWYPKPFSTIKSDYFNIGDMVVHDSTLKLIDYNSVEGVVIERIDDELIEWYKTFDYILIRASNFIHNEMNWLHGLEVIEKINLPVYVVGVGAQSAGGSTYKLNDHNLNFWKEVSNRSQSIGVRGEFTAELLENNGIKNVEIVGCPTIFRTRNKELQIKLPNNIKNIAFSIRREADSTYTPNIMEYLNTQRNLLLSSIENYNTTITIHGEPEEKSFYYHDLKAQAIATIKFIDEGWWTKETKDKMKEIYLNQLFFFLKVEDYDEFIITQDLAIGYRVHGILPALANGVAGFLFTYDSRSGELAKTHKIPSISTNNTPLNLADLIERIDFTEFNSNYQTGYEKMKSFLTQNNIDNKM